MKFDCGFVCKNVVFYFIWLIKTTTNYTMIVWDGINDYKFKAWNFICKRARLFCQIVCYFRGKLFMRLHTYIPTPLCFDTPVFHQLGLYFDIPMCRHPFIPTPLYSDTPMFHTPLCSDKTSHFRIITTLLMLIKTQVVLQVSRRISGPWVKKGKKTK